MQDYSRPMVGFLALKFSILIAKRLFKETPMKIKNHSLKDCNRSPEHSSENSMQKFQPVQKLRQLKDYANFSNVEKLDCYYK